MRKQLVISVLIAFVVLALLFGIFYRQPIKNITDRELDAIKGIKVTFVDGSVNYGPISARIVDYINQNPSCTVEDLRIVKGVDNYIINQLKKEFR